MWNTVLCGSAMIIIRVEGPSLWSKWKEAIRAGRCLGNISEVGVLGFGVRVSQWNLHTVLRVSCSQLDQLHLVESVQLFLAISFLGLELRFIEIKLWGYLYYSE